jgi:tetratricopeptide (TPR) repeat protein
MHDSQRRAVRKNTVEGILEIARIGFYAGLPVAVMALILFGETIALVVVGVWLSIVVLTLLYERVWSKREATRALVPAVLWIVLPGAGSMAGTIRLACVSLVRVGIVFGLPVGTYAAFRWGGVWWVIASFLAWFLVLLGLAVAAARDRLIIGSFEYVSMGTEAAAPAEVDVADLLRGEISRLSNLLHVVGDRRAVSSGVNERTPLDATLSVDELSEAFRGAAGEQITLKLGQLTIPLAPLVHLLGRLVASARITGRLHQDGDNLILTAQTTGARRIAWRVDASKDGRAKPGRRGSIVGSPGGERWLEELSTRNLPAAHAASPGLEDADPPVVATMVRELALRIYTDLALDQSVRWEACGHFVAGLRAFRSCLRTPKDRKMNLRGAEGEFLEALAEDEDFPLAYYNLGVVYTELLSLAVAAGRSGEAHMRRSAAETSFGRAIEKSPHRWDCHFAFAQTRLSDGRWSEAVELCDFMLRRGGLTLTEQARTRELIAQALLPHEWPAIDHPVPPVVDAAHVQRARQEARRAAELSLRVLSEMRARRKSLRSGSDEQAQRATQLASACILTYGKCYLHHVLAGHEERQPISKPERRHIRSVLWVLWRLGDTHAELLHYFGLGALLNGDLEFAEGLLREAAGSAPTRPDYAADLALSRVRRLARESEYRQPPRLTPPEREFVLLGACSAITAMAKAFFPAHDVAACRSLVTVYDELAWLPVAGAEPNQTASVPDWGLVAIASAMELTATEIEQTLQSRSSSTSTSGVFLQALVVPEGTDARALVGEYGETVRHAYDSLVDGQTARYGDDGDVRSARGGERAAIERFETALQEAERATSLNPLSTFAWETLGDIFAEFSDYGHARDAWNQALRTDPDNPHLYAKIGQSHWNIAFQGGMRPEPDELRRAAREFESALLLYGNDDRAERILTHYRLSKLNAVLGRSGEARRHLQIVDAASDQSPVVGGLVFAMACLRHGDYSEGEFYFSQVIREGRKLYAGASRLRAPNRHRMIVGDRLDERLWPLGLVRAWAHVGLALSWIDRDAREKPASGELLEAQRLLRGLYGNDGSDLVSHERFPTRIKATMAEAQARLMIDHGAAVDVAIKQFEGAVSQYPYSRAYQGLAEALELKAERSAPADRLRRRATALTELAAKLGSSEKVNGTHASSGSPQSGNGGA